MGREGEENGRVRIVLDDFGGFGGRRRRCFFGSRWYVGNGVKSGGEKVESLERNVSSFRATSNIGLSAAGSGIEDDNGSESDVTDVLSEPGDWCLDGRS